LILHCHLATILFKPYDQIRISVKRRQTWTRIWRKGRGGWYSWYKSLIGAFFHSFSIWEEEEDCGGIATRTSEAFWACTVRCQAIKNATPIYLLKTDDLLRHQLLAFTLPMKHCLRSESLTRRHWPCTSALESSCQCYQQMHGINARRTPLSQCWWATEHCWSHGSRKIIGCCWYHIYTNIGKFLWLGMKRLWGPPISENVKELIGTIWMDSSICRRSIDVIPDQEVISGQTSLMITLIQIQGHWTLDHKFRHSWFHSHHMLLVLVFLGKSRAISHKNRSTKEGILFPLVWRCLFIFETGY